MKWKKKIIINFDIGVTKKKKNLLAPTGYIQNAGVPLGI